VGESLQRLHAETGLQNLERWEESIQDVRGQDEFRASEMQEQIDTLALALHGEVGVTPDAMNAPFPDQIETAVAVLRKAADTVRRRDWRHARHLDGRRVFGRGRRRTLVEEADCARSLVDLFTTDTSRALYDYVGELLIATVPSLEAWGRERSRRKRRLRDAVKQLLSTGPGGS